MQVIPTLIPDVLIIKPKVFEDERGYFLESYNQKAFDACVSTADSTPHVFVQDNHSQSRCGVLRGLHYQAEPSAQGKLVRVIQGAVWDVAVDIRHDSPTYGHWVGAHLSGENFHQLWIPPGFAHGFLTLTGHAICTYKTTHNYDAKTERCIQWDDPDLAIAWPLDLLASRMTRPILSSKDLAGASFKSMRHAGL